MAGGKLTNINDQLMLKQAIYEKDKKALAFLHAKFYPKIRLHIIGRTGSVTDADDLTQDVFVELSKGGSHYDGNSDPGNYLCGVANNIVHKHLRKKKIPAVKIRYELITNLVASPEQDHPSCNIQTEELKKTIEKALAKLTPKTRQAIKLRFIQNMTIKQAAQEVGCSLKTFRDRLNYAINVLQKDRKIFLRKFPPK